MSSYGPAEEQSRRPLEWLVWVFLLGGVALAVAAILVEDRRGLLLGLTAGAIVAAVVVGLVGRSMARQRSSTAIGPIIGGSPVAEGVATSTAATTTAFDPQTGVGQAEIPGPLGSLMRWGLGSVGRMHAPSRIFRMLALFFLFDALVVIGMAVAFPEARPGLIAGGAVLVVLAVGAFMASRTVGRRLDSLWGAAVQGLTGGAGGGDQGIGSIGALVEMAERMAGSMGVHAGSFDLSSVQVQAGGGASSADALKAHLDKVGVSGTGTIQQVTNTGVVVNGAQVLAVTMSVAVPGKPDVPSSTAALVAPDVAARLQAGRSIPVRIDPSNPQMVEADWAKATP